MNHALPRVLIGVHPGRHVRRAAIEGLLAYQHRFRPWRDVYVVHGEVDATTIGSFRDVDAIIASVQTVPGAHELYERLCHRRCPVVLMLCPREMDALPRVYEDDAAIGRLAAQHLISQGHRRLHAIAWGDLSFSTARAHAFVEEAQRRGISANITLMTVARRSVASRRRDEYRWEQWLARIEFPAAIFTTDTALAHEITSAASNAGITIPEQLAILVANDDPVACSMGPAPLSAIDCDLVRLGYETARLMHRLLQGEPPPPGPVLIPPARVVVRRSTEALAIEDADLATAIRWIREHALQPIRVGDVLKIVPMSRRSLERGFRQALKCSVMDEIARVRIEHARRLLAETDLDLWTIAQRCAFGHRSRLYERFQRATGMTPRQYREQNKGDTRTWKR